MAYIHQLGDWPAFRWDLAALAEPLGKVRLSQGRLLGRMEGLGFHRRQEAELEALTHEVVKTSEIEGEVLSSDQVRSSVARRLGMETAAVHPVDRRVEGVVEMTLEAAQNYGLPLSADRVCAWHRLLFPDPPPWVRSGTWRDDARGPMQVVSGRPGRQRVHYEAPPAARLEAETAAFFGWVNAPGSLDPILHAAQAHLWFVTIHPFDDGNGRVARAIADWALARSEQTPHRYYSMSAQIRRERDAYYDILERTQRGTLEVTAWMRWFIDCLHRAVVGAEASLGAVFKKDRFWSRHAHLALNDRQRRVMNLLNDGELEGKLTSSKWAKLTGCSQDTATRDLQDLAAKGVLVQASAGGRSTSYSLREPREE